MEFPSKELLNYGVAGIVLVPVMGFILWAGRAVVRSLLVHIDEFFRGVLEQQKESSGAMKELARAFADISARCLACRVDSVSTVRDLESSLTKKFVEVSSAAHDRTFAEVQAGLAKIGSQFETALTQTAQSIRRDQATLVAEMERKHLEEEASRLREENAELSRPHDVGDGAVRR